MGDCQWVTPGRMTLSMSRIRAGQRQPEQRCAGEAAKGVGLTRPVQAVLSVGVTFGMMLVRS